MNLDASSILHFLFFAQIYSNCSCQHFGQAAQAGAVVVLKLEKKVSDDLSLVMCRDNKRERRRESQKTSITQGIIFSIIPNYNDDDDGQWVDSASPTPPEAQWDQKK